MREQQYFVILVIVVGAFQEVNCHIEKPLSGIAIHKTTFHLNEKAHVNASPAVLGSNVIIAILSSSCQILFDKNCQTSLNFLFGRVNIVNMCWWNLVLHTHQMMTGLECFHLQISCRLLLNTFFPNKN